MISYLKHSEIDKQKWDRCIELSPNGLIYGCSWYLDIVSPGWEALIENDYETIMPLSGKSKFGVHYLFQPHFTQQLGIFSVKSIEENKIEQFLKSIPRKYRLVDINLNFANEISELEIIKQKRVNYELNLNLKYDLLYNQYTASNKDSLKRAYKKDQLKISPDVSLSELIDLFRKTSEVKLKNRVVETLNKLHKKALSGGICEMYGLYDNENKLLAASSYIHYKNRLLFFTSISSREGKKKRAMFQMLDYITKKYAGSKIILDFEGSNMPSIARFFAGFGPVPTTYYRVQLNRLPEIVSYAVGVFRRIHL